VSRCSTISNCKSRDFPNKTCPISQRERWTRERRGSFLYGDAPLDIFSYFYFRVFFKTRLELALFCPASLAPRTISHHLVPRTISYYFASRIISHYLAPRAVSHYSATRTISCYLALRAIFYYLLSVYHQSKSLPHLAILIAINKSEELQFAHTAPTRSMLPCEENFIMFVKNQNDQII